MVATPGARVLNIVPGTMPVTKVAIYLSDPIVLDKGFLVEVP